MTEPASLNVIIDSSFVLSLVRQRRDPGQEILDAIPRKASIRLLDLIALEIERLARKGTATTRTWARTSLTLMEKRGYPILEHKAGPADVDSSLISFVVSEKVPTAVATVDKELATALKSFGIPVIRPRSRHGVVVEGPS